MTAVDTNVLLRLITADDPVQHRRARRLFAEEDIWIGNTVVLETEWVLRSLYGFDVQTVAEALRRLTGLPNVFLENAAAVADALAWAANGIDFADGLHLACAPSGCAFASFDSRLVKRARNLGLKASAV